MKTTIQPLLMKAIIPLLALFITACATPNNSSNMNKEPATPIASSDLTSMKWALVSIAQKGKPASTLLNSGPEANRFNFTFKDGRLSIRGGCNSLSGAYRIEPDNRITLGPMMSTKMACARPLMKADNEILSYLSGVTDFSISGPDLTLITAFQQRLTFKGAPLKQ